MKTIALFKKTLLSLMITAFSLSGYAQLNSNKNLATGSNEVLPVYLTSLSLKSEEPDKITVEWTTESERNNSHFIISIAEKNSLNFVKLAQVKGLGNSDAKHNYVFSINNLASITLTGSLPFLLFLLIPSIRNRILRGIFFAVFVTMAISCVKEEKEIVPSTEIKSFYVRIEQVDYDGLVTVFYTRPIAVEVTKK